MLICMSEQQDFDKRVGENLLRLRGDMTQKELADKMRSRGHKWSQATVWSVEKGERALKYSEVDDLLSVLGEDIFSFHWSPLLASEKGTNLRHAMNNLAERQKELKDVMQRYNEALTELVIAADLATENPEGVPNYLWGAAREWLENGTLVAVALREDRRHFLPDVEGAQDEMLDLDVTTFEELVDVKRQEAQAKGYKTLKEEFENEHERHSVWQSVRKLAKENEAEEVDNGIDSETR